MRLFRSLFRLLLVVLGALVGLGLFVLGLLGFMTFLLIRLLTGRKPEVSFRVNKNPWAARRAPPSGGDVVDIEAREVPETAPLPLRAPEQGTPR